MTNIFKLLILTIGFSTFIQAQSFDWAIATQGSHVDEGNAVCMDAVGNSYVAGTFSSPKFVVATSTLANSSVEVGVQPVTDVFVAKFDPKGKLLWTFQSNGVGEERAVDIACDGMEHVALVGLFKGKSAKFGSRELVNPAATSYSTFIVRLNSLGNVVWAQVAGGKTQTIVESVATGPNGEIYLTGSFAGGVTFGGYEYKSRSGNNASVFIAKYDKDGLLKWFEQVWGTRPGGQNSSQVGNAIFATGDSRFVYVAGWFRGRSNFGDQKSIVSNTEPHPSGIRLNLFIAKYDSDGNIKWVEQIGTKQINASADAELTDIVADGSGSVYLTGFSPGVLMFGSTEARGTQSRNGWNNDVFVAKYDGDGKHLWHRMGGGKDSDKSNSIALTSSGVSITGVVSSLDARFGDTAMPKGLTQTFVASYDFDGKLTSLTGAKMGLPNQGNGIASNGATITVTGSFLATSMSIGKFNLRSEARSTMFTVGAGVQVRGKGTN